MKNILPPGEELAPDVEAGFYRFFHDIPISFEDGIKLTIQHGAVGQTYSYYSSACFSYRQKLPKARVTDFIDVSSPASREMHSYTAYDAESGEAIPNEAVDALLYEREGKIEGDRSSAHLSKRAILHDGKISFYTAVEKENNGVVARVLTDLSSGPMKARVFVDGSDAGIWSLPEFNEHAPFGDYDFEIPGSLSFGKERLYIEIVPDAKFADTEYKIISRLK